MKTDDIIKLLKVCSTASGCSSCPLVDSTDCAGEVSLLALDVINLQKVEIDSLQKRIVNWREDMGYHPEKIRTEAIKEFAERLNIHVIPQKRDGYTCDIVLKSSIDYLVKEMTEEHNEP